MGVEPLGTIAPATRPGPRPNEWGPDAVAPDTVRDGETAPLVEPVRASSSPPTVPMATMPLARPRGRGNVERLTYEVYEPDDTRRLRPLPAPSGRAALEARKKTVGLFAVGVAIMLSTVLMAVGSCDDGATGRVETTAAPVAPAQAPSTAGTASTAATDVIPPIVFSPPLAPPPRRSARPTKR